MLLVILINIYFYISYIDNRINDIPRIIYFRDRFNSYETIMYKNDSLRKV